MPHSKYRTANESIIINNSIKRGKLAIKVGTLNEGHLVTRIEQRPIAKLGSFSIANSPLFMLLPYNIMNAGIPLVLAGPLKTN